MKELMDAAKKMNQILHQCEEEGDNICMIEGCSCKKFDSYQVILLKTIRELKKTVVDIKFMTEDEVKDDPLTWNCLNRHQYSES